MGKLGLCTTVYRGVERFLADWYQSVLVQTDQDFDLWIASDNLDVASVIQAMGGTPNARWVMAERDDLPAGIRQRAFARIVETCDSLVLVDSDDVLHPSRIAAARSAMQCCDLYGCALRLIDEAGFDLSGCLSLPAGTDPVSVLPRNNVFGLSNSAIRSQLLERCLPIPCDVELVDWFLATRAWLLGARLTFDPFARMSYRQHGANTARVCGPFTTAQVVVDTARVRKHFRIVRTNPPPGFIQERFNELEQTAGDIELFYQRVILDVEQLDRYVAAFNALVLPPLWWSCVAHPVLSHFWRPVHSYDQNS